MAITIATIYDPNTRHPTLGGDLSVALIECSFTVNYPGNPGEVMDLSALFRQVHGVAFAGFSANAAATALMPMPFRISNTQWNIQFFESGANAGDPFPEKGAEAYADAFAMRFLVYGRPRTDAS